MFVPYPSLKLKYIGYFIIGLVFAILVSNNYLLHNKVKKLEKEQKDSIVAKQVAEQKAELTIKSMTLQYQTLSKQREEQYEKEIKTLNDQYDITKSKLNSLQQSQTQIRSNVHSPSTSRETIIKYVDRYESVFTECTGRLTEMATEADKRGLMINNLNLEINQIYNLLEEYRQTN